VLVQVLAQGRDDRGSGEQHHRQHQGSRRSGADRGALRRAAGR
jgi:hypothetical protein